MRSASVREMSAVCSWTASRSARSADVNRNAVAFTVAMFYDV